MKLLFITNNFPPISCGVGDYTYYLALEFVKNGYEVHVICRSYPDIVLRWQDQEEHLKVHPIGGTWQKADWQRVLQQMASMAPTHVLFQYVPGAYNRLAVPWNFLYFFKGLKKLPIQVITTFHETYVRYNFKHPKYLYVALGQRYLARYIAQHSHRLVTSIDRYARQLKPWNQQVSIIPIGSNIPPIPVEEADIQALKQQLASNGERIICTFGNRNHTPLVNLFKELLAQEPKVVLLIIGKLNGQLDGLSAQVRDKIHVTGFLEANEVFKYLKAGDAFILFDKVGKNGNGGTCNKSGSLAAAFAAGLPIFGTMGDMTNHLLKDESPIIFIDYNHLNASAKNILAYLNSNSKLTSKAKASLAFFEQYLTFGKLKNAYLNLLKY